MTRIFNKAVATRAIILATAVGVSPMAATTASAGALAECYGYIMSACDDSLTEYNQCIGEGFDLCDNQHPEPLQAGDLDLNFLPASQRRVVRAILAERDVPARVYRFVMVSDDDGRDQSGGGRDGGASSAPSR